MTRTLLLLFILVFAMSAHAQYSRNWTENELMEPSDLSAMIKSGKRLPLILSVGPGAVIPDSKDVGMVKEADNLEKLKALLAGVSKDTAVVIYCGCCPFERCPNVRPAIEVLKRLKFTNYKLLDLPHNIKIDWIDKGYPTKE